MNPKTGRWSYIGPEKAKDKVGHALRKASRAKSKKVKAKKLAPQEGTATQEQKSGGSSSSSDAASFHSTHHPEEVAASQASRQSIPLWHEQVPIRIPLKTQEKQSSYSTPGMRAAGKSRQREQSASTKPAGMAVHGDLFANTHSDTSLPMIHSPSGDARVYAGYVLSPQSVGVNTPVSRNIFEQKHQQDEEPSHHVDVSSPAASFPIPSPLRNNRSSSPQMDPQPPPLPGAPSLRPPPHYYYHPPPPCYYYPPPPYGIPPTYYYPAYYPPPPPPRFDLLPRHTYHPSRSDPNNGDEESTKDDSSDTEET
jgi:hypothetical protein